MRKILKEIENYIKHETLAPTLEAINMNLWESTYLKKFLDYFKILGLSIQPLISFFHQKKLI